VAFVSNRSGDSEIWLADLDKTGEERYTNLSNTPHSAEDHPIWTGDGSKLAWSSASQNIGFSGIYVWNALQPERPATWVGDGNWPAWNSSGDRLVTVVDGPNQEYLTSYTLDGELLLQPIPLPGPMRGLIWPNMALPNPLPKPYADAAAQTPLPEWTAAVTQLAEGPSQRYALNTLPDVQAPYPQLHDAVDESFEALRKRFIEEAGWDVLASLSNAFVPLTTALDPGLGEDWLFTGRAFDLNPLMSNAGWMVAVRQDYGSQTYWKLYLRTQLQDGTQGEPLHNPPWDLAARYDLDPRSYEQGGKYAEVLPGYWLDFTTLARQYGWERLPALPNWRTYYSGARFTEFALTGGLDWYSAMLEIYPKDVLVTPTHILPPSPTPTRTPRPTSTPVPTRTPRPTASPTSPPTATNTATDIATNTATDTVTAFPSPTP
ncbi:MAG: TolB family protein, partial [Anaerolineales bacterium]